MSTLVSHHISINVVKDNKPYVCILFRLKYFQFLRIQKRAISKALEESEIQYSKEKLPFE